MANTNSTSERIILDFQLNPDWAKLPLFDGSGWRRLPFGAFAESINERVEPANAADEVYVGLDDLDSGSLHIRRWGRGSDVIGTKLRFRRGDLIFGRRRAYQRKLAVAEMDGICSAHALVVRAKPDVMLPEFLPFLMMSDKFMNRAVEISVGSLSPTINWTTLKLQEFDLPPLDQQRRFAEILWAVDAVKTRFEVACAEFQKAYDTFLNEKLVDAPYPSTILGNLNSTGSLDLQTGPFGTVLQASSYVKTGTPIINPVNMVKHRLVTTDGPFLNDKECERLSRYKMKVGDILLGRKGDVGRAVLVIPEYAGYIIGSDIIRLRVQRELIQPEYLYYFLMAPKVRMWIARHASGTTMPGINEKLINGISIPIPPISHQSEIIRAITNMDLADKSFLENLSAISELLRSLANHLAASTL